MKRGALWAHRVSKSQTQLSNLSMQHMRPLAKSDLIIGPSVRLNS